MSGKPASQSQLTVRSWVTSIRRTVSSLAAVLLLVATMPGCESGSSRDGSDAAIPGRSASADAGRPSTGSREAGVPDDLCEQFKPILAVLSPEDRAVPAKDTPEQLARAVRRTWKQSRAPFNVESVVMCNTRNPESITGWVDLMVMRLARPVAVSTLERWGGGRFPFPGQRIDGLGDWAVLSPRDRGTDSQDVMFAKGRSLVMLKKRHEPDPGLLVEQSKRLAQLLG